MNRLKGLFSKPLAVCEISDTRVRTMTYIPRHHDKDVEVLGFSERAFHTRLEHPFESLSEIAELLMQTLDEVQNQAGFRLKSLAMNIDDPQMESLSTKGTVYLEKNEKTILSGHVRLARQRAKAQVRPCEKHLVYCQDAGYLIDEKYTVSDPVGMFGKKFSVILHLMFASSYCIQSLENLAERCDVRLKGLYPSVMCTLKALIESRGFGTSNRLRDIKISDIPFDHSEFAVLTGLGLLNQKRFKPNLSFNIIRPPLVKARRSINHFIQEYF